MQTNKTKVALYILLGISTAVALYFFWQTQSIQKDFEAYREVNAQDSADILIEELKTIDSLLFEGNYEEAASLYEQKLNHVPDTLKNGLTNRLAFLDQFKKYKRQATAARNDVGKTKQDSINLPVEMPLEDTRKIDSILFVLKKSRLKIQNLQRQLEQKSAGEYLTFESSKGSKVHYVGQVKNNKAHGKGIALLETGSRYEGNWKENQRHGEGAFYWPDGEYYIGEYKNDKREGTGKYFWPNGEKYVGQWVDDKRNGKGTFYNEEGEIITSGIWQNDELVQENS